MSSIIYSWVSHELNLNGQSVEKLFANGYFLGKLLNKYNKFQKFYLLKNSSSPESIVRNFSHLRPALHEMGINIDAHLSHDIITEKPGSIQQLLYQIYVILSCVDGCNRCDIIDFRNVEHTQLNTLQNLSYKNQLKQLIPRQSDVSLAQILSRYERQMKINKKQIKEAELMDTLEKDALVQKRRNSRLQRSHDLRLMQSELMAKLEASIINLPKSDRKKLATKSMNTQQIKQTHASSMSLKELDDFDSRKEKCELYNSNASRTGDKSSEQLSPNLTLNISTDDFNKATMNYMKQIHKKVGEEKKAITERQRRRRRVIMDILEANHIRQEEIRSEQIMQRLSRQSHLESRISVQLEQIKQEKSIILENRLERERQYETRRELEFQLAMDHEREMLLQQKEEEKEKFAILKQFWFEQRAKRQQASYKRHYEFIQNDIIPLLLQFVMNVADYRIFTGKLVPLRFFRQWKIEFVSGLLVNDASSTEDQAEDPVEEEMSNVANQLKLKKNQIIEDQQELLDDCDLEEYQNLTGDWNVAKIGTLYTKSLPNEFFWHVQGKPIEWIDFKDECKTCEFKLPNDINLIKTNPVLEWIIKRLYKLNFPPTIESNKSDLPEFPIKLALLGKPLSGKTTIISQLEKNNRCVGINPYKLIEEALKAYENKETDECSNTPVESSTLPGTETSSTVTLSAKAKLGESLWNELKVGNEISDDLLVDLVYEKIKSLQPTIGFILDGFPTNYNQAKLLEQKLTGNKSNNIPLLLDVQNSTDLKLKNGLDLIILLDISDELILKRVAHTTISKTALNDSLTKYTTAEEIPYNNQVDIQTNTSSNQIHTMNNNSEVDENQNSTYSDNFNYSSYILQETHGNIPERLVNFIQSWPKLYKFYQKQNSNLCVVNLTDLLYNTKFYDYDIENNDESMKLAVYLEIERQIEEFIKCKENNALVKTIPVEQIEFTGNDRTIVMNVGEDVEKENDDEKEAESKRTLFASSTRELTNNDDQNDHYNNKKSDIQDYNMKDDKLKARNGSTNSLRLTQRPVTAKTSSSGKNSTTSRQSNRSKKEGSAESQRKTVGSRSPSGGRSAKQHDNKERRTNSNDRNKQVESVQKDKSRSRSGSEKKQPKKTKLKSTDSPQSVKETDKEQTVILQPDLPQPGDENYQFVDLPVMNESAHILWEFWNSTETIYNRNLKSIFRQIRSLNSNIIPHMYHIKQQFYIYLYRPDSKQHFLNQFISSFNSLLNEMRSDKETKADLHCRTDDLRDTLYEIIDETKQANENRLKTLLDIPGWFTDKQILLINSYLSLLQIELTRFQENAQLIKDYYEVMEARPQTVENESIQALSGTIDASQIEYTRIPLIKLPDEIVENGDSSGSRKSTSTRQNSSRSSSNRLNKSKLTDSGNTVLSKYPTPIDMKFEILPSEFRSQINLLNPNSSLQEIFAAFSKNGLPLTSQTVSSNQPNQKGTKPGAVKANSIQEKVTLSNPINLLLDKPTPSTDSSIQFLYNVFLSAMQIILNQVQTERKSRANEAMLDGYTVDLLIKPTDTKGGKLNSADKNKGGQPRKGQRKSVGPKEKGSKPDEQATTPVELTEEDQKAREVRQHIREEHIAALEKEAAKTAFRFTLIRAQGSAVLSDLQEKFSQLKQFMTDCIGIKTLKEHDAVNNTLEVIRYMIEKEQKLPEKMILDGEQFYIDESDTISPISNDSLLMEKLRINSPVINKPTESEPQYFNLSQLKYLCDKFSTLSQTGFIDVFNFQSILKPILTERFTELTGSCSTDTLNELLTCLVYKYRLSFETNSVKISATTDYNDLIKVNNTHEKQVYYIDWRQFLLAACQPAITYHHSTVITQSSLVELSQRLMELDQSVKHENLLNVKVTRAQFQFASFKWFPVGVKNYEELHDFIFSIFTKKVSQSKTNQTYLKNDSQNTETCINSQNYETVSMEETVNCSDLLLNISVIQVKSPYIGFLRCLSTLLGRHVPYISVHNQLMVDLCDMEYEGVPQNCPDDPIPKEILEKILSFGLVNTNQCRTVHDDLETSQVLDASEPGNFLISDKLQDIFTSLENNGQPSTLKNLLHNMDFQNLLISSLAHFKGIAQFSEPWITALQTYFNDSFYL